MFNANLLLAQAIQKDQLRIARRERIGRQMMEIARKKLLIGLPRNGGQSAPSTTPSVHCKAQQRKCER